MTDALARRVRNLPGQLDRAIAKVAALKTEAKRYGFTDLAEPVVIGPKKVDDDGVIPLYLLRSKMRVAELTKPDAVNAAWDRAMEGNDGKRRKR